MAETPNQTPAALDGYLREHIAPRCRDLVNAAEQKVTAAETAAES